MWGAARKKQRVGQGRAWKPGGYSVWEFTLLLDGFLTQPGETSDYVDIKDSQVRHLEDIVGGRVSGISCSGAVSN